MICVQWNLQYLFQELVLDIVDCLGLVMVQVLSFVSTEVGDSSHVSRLTKSLRCLPVRVVECSSGHLTEDLLVWSEGPLSSVASLRSLRVPFGMVWEVSECSSCPLW